MGNGISKSCDSYNYTSLKLLEPIKEKSGEIYREYNIQDLIEKARELKHSDFDQSFNLYFKCLKYLKNLSNNNRKIYKDVVEFEVKDLNKNKKSLKMSEETIDKDKSSSMSSIADDNLIKLNKKIGCLYDEIGDLFCIHDKLEKSLFYYEKASSYEPSKIDYIYKKGVVYQQMGRNEKAILTFKRILSTNENHIPTLFAIGNLYRYIDCNTALTYFDSILKIEPNNTEVLSLVASCYDNLGNINEAISYQNKVVQINPENFNHKKFAQKLIATKMQN